MHRNMFVFTGIDGAKTESDALRSAMERGVNVTVHYHTSEELCQSKRHTDYEANIGRIHSPEPRKPTRPVPHASAMVNRTNIKR